MRTRRRRRWCGLTLLAVLAVLGALMLDSAVRLVTTEYELSAASFGEEWDGFRILQLSDLHGREFGEGNRRLLAAARAAEPDLIVLTGDFVEKPEDLPVLARLLPELVRLAPCCFVSGNHEWGSQCVEETAALLEKNGVRYLRNESEVLRRGTSELVLCGVEDPNSWAQMIRPDELTEKAAAEHPGMPLVLLGHRNYWTAEYPELPVDLILCGHGHGGIIRLPFIGGLLGTDRELLPKCVSGCFRSGRYTMVVSRGLGTVRGIPRFLNNPELVVVTLKNAA